MTVSYGYVKLHRQILDWGWYDTPNTFKLFIHLLLTANHKEGVWKNVTIMPGQRITSVQKLCSEINLSTQQIRTALDHLIATKEITIKTTKTYTLITIANWSLYQQQDEIPTNNITYESTTTVTNDQQTINKRATNEQQLSKNEKNKKNNIDSELRSRVAEYCGTDLVLAERLNEWIEMRKDIKSKITSVRALNIALNKLTSLGGNPVEIVEEAILRNWKSFYSNDGNSNRQQKIAGGTWLDEQPIIGASKNTKS